MNERNQGTVFIDKKTGKVNTGLVIYNKNWAYWVDSHESWTHLLRIEEWDYTHLAEWQKKIQEQNKNVGNYYTLGKAGISKKEVQVSVDEYRWFTAEKVARKAGVPEKEDKNIWHFNYELDYTLPDTELDALKWFVYDVFGLPETEECNQFSSWEEYKEKTSPLSKYYRERFGW